jgi:hypothetical protein
MELKKATPVRLRDVEKDEKWLQKTISDDPSILGLGDLSILQRERTQFTGGRIDFLMYNPEDGVRYEVEVMLGTLDESHIIRTIEYWDVERRRFPALEHRAVIIAEEITNRFFNVIGLLNRSVPIIAIQLNAITIDNSLILQFVKVLDIVESGDEEEQGTEELTDRRFWENKASVKSLEVMDKLLKLCGDKPLRITYNKNHVALGTSGRNFAWFHPRKGAHIHFGIRTGPEIRDEFHKRLEDVGIYCHKSSDQNNLRIQLTMKELTDNVDLLQDLFNKAEAIYAK